MRTVVSFKHEIEIIIDREKSEVGLSNQLHSRRRTSQSLRGRNNKLCSQKAPQQLIMKYIAFFIFLSLIVISGCSVLQNSETFYRDHPRGPINWREYLD